jgi:murein DD-endopeptidase MepM/ murein hydrolase activator NlpD
MSAKPLIVAALAAAAAFAVTSPAHSQDFTYQPAGDLVSGSGQGLADSTVYAPGMRFPMEQGPAFANSQVWGHGGSQGPGGGQCDAENFSYPWHDNYCETRQWDMPLCPAGTGHQGQDIRAATCDKDVHWAVAAADGTITNIGGYSVYLTSADGTRFDYLHMSNVQVSVGQDVKVGDRLGKVSNAFGGTPTTVHLHFNIRQNVSGLGNVYVPPYMSLVEAYSTLVGGGSDPCMPLGPDGGIIDDIDECFRTYGPLAYWRVVDDAGHGGSLLWTNAFESQDPSNWAQWRVEPSEDGRYGIDVHIDPAWGVHHETRYDVEHVDGTEQLTIDQSTEQGWVSLGEYQLEAGTEHLVSVYDIASGPVPDEQHIAVDALRATRVDGDTPPPPDDPPPAGAGGATANGPVPTSDEGSCRAAPGRAPRGDFALLALLAAALCWRRRR